MPVMAPRPAPRRPSAWPSTLAPLMALVMALLMALLMALAGCAAPTPFEPPVTALPATWAHGAPAQAEGRAPPAVDASLIPTAFTDDAALLALLGRIDEGNLALAATALRVQRARLLAGLADNARWPQPGASATAQAGRAFDGSGSGRTDKAFGATLGLTLEVDLWGRLAAERDLAGWEARASAEDHRQVRLALRATAASLYYRLGLLNDRIRLGEANIDNAARTRDLVEARYRLGAASALEQAEARQSLRTLQAAHEGLLQQRVEARNALATLAAPDSGPDLAVPDNGPDLSAQGAAQGAVQGAVQGAAQAVAQAVAQEAAREATHGPAQEPARLPAIDIAMLPAGLPAAALACRPDLQAAEARLRARLAAVDVARTSFYPAFTLNASAGGTSDSLRRVLADPVGTMAAGLALPFLNVTRARLTTAVAQADFDAAVLEFRQALLTAFTDVDNALSAGERLREEQGHLDAALEAAAGAERLYEARYREGAVGLRDWISAQDRRRLAELGVLGNRHDRYVNGIAALQALGVALPVAPPSGRPAGPMSCPASAP